MTDAIHKDVSQEEEVEESPLANDRLSFIDEMVETQRKAREEELGTPPSEEDAGEEEEHEEEEPEQEEETPEPEKPQMVTVKVDGEEKEVPLSDVIARYQKGEAADRRLEEAARLKKEAELLRAQPTPPKQDAEEEPQITRAELIKALQYGTEEEAAEALEKYEAQGRKQPTFDLEKHYAEIERRLDARKREDAWKVDNKDIADDPNLYGMVFQRTAQRIQSGETRDVFEVATEEAEAVREWMKKFAPAPSQQQQQKIDRKRSLDHVPAAEGKQEPPKEEKPKTNAEVIAEMAASRPGG